MAERYGHPFTVAYFDLDNFKATNDAVGHSVGNELLARVAETVGDRIRKTDVPGRLGGDEFVILFDRNRIRFWRESNGKDKERAFQGDASQRPAGYSPRGTSDICFPPPKSVDEMIQTADDLMYEAKASGKNLLRVGFSPPSSHETQASQNV